MSLERYFTAYDEWRQGALDALKSLARTLESLGVANEVFRSRLDAARERLREECLRLAFVAEFSRGKSELINALVFSSLGARALPSRSGRTTMCPTEIEWFEGARPEVLLLPIDTRREIVSLHEARRRRECWSVQSYNPENLASVQQALERVGETRRIPVDEAESLGFHIDPSGEEGLVPGEDGLVEVPAWRHAIVRYPHPLLARGLVILDTPGLNAIGAETELTLSLLPQAHAVVFVLAADTGVTQSDMKIWRHYVLESRVDPDEGCLVALNKIDSLWDGIRTEAEIEREIAAQVQSVARMLEVRPEHVFPLSAQKALAARIHGDEALLRRSRIEPFEQALSQDLLGKRQALTREAVAAAFREIGALAAGMVRERLSAVAAQESELAALRGQNRSRVAYLLRKAQAEKEEFDAALRRYQATRAVYAKQCRELLDAVAVSRFRFELTDVRHQMEMAAFSLDLKERIEQFFERVFALVDRAQAKAKEIHEMLTAMMRQLEVEHGIDCRPPAPLDFAAARASLETARTLALRQLASWGTMLVHTKSGVIERFLSLVASEVQHRWEAMHREAATWVRQALLPLEAALKEKKTELELRMNGIVRVHQAAESLESQLAELRAERERLEQQLQRLETALQQGLETIARPLLERAA
ncbi:dynamin family protein [Tepidiphilus succinatimandens]|uniref:dynamin family protein n=1 Tax=Tepidiphilus succinatimandens TaxID=224436 RepID=UPI001476A822|nr:dynamin family protein [Tepidiphilus succinatimandens]